MKIPCQILQDAMNWTFLVSEIKAAIAQRDNDSRITVKEIKSCIQSVVDNNVMMQIAIIYIPVIPQDNIRNEDLLINLVWTKQTGFRITGFGGAELCI